MTQSMELQVIQVYLKRRFVTHKPIVNKKPNLAKEAQKRYMKF